MKRSHAPRIRALLKKCPEGLTINNIQMALDIPSWSIRQSLMAMVDCYIDRWVVVKSARGQYSSVWCIVEVPEHCPRPNKKGTK